MAAVPLALPSLSLELTRPYHTSGSRFRRLLGFPAPLYQRLYVDGMTAPDIGCVKPETRRAVIPSPIITRFAPSPTGLLHLGHAFSAVLGFAIARISGGEWALRIEDIDPGRARPAFTDAILHDLEWLGLHPDGPIVVQSANRPRHLALLGELRDRGLLYPCTCTRADIQRVASAPHAGETTRYPGTCRGRSDIPADVHAWRLDLAATGLPMEQHWQDLLAGRQAGMADSGGDPVLLRKDGAIAYHLACVVDDADRGVNLVVRGEDLAEATPIQRLLQNLLGFPEMATLHHGLLLDSDGKRLAKRDRAATLAAMRESGKNGGELRAELLQMVAPVLKQAGFIQSAGAFSILR